MQRRGEFSFPGSPARGLPPRAPAILAAPRAAGEEEARWLQASLHGSPDYGSGSGGSGTPSPQLWAPHGPHPHHRTHPASAGSSPSRAQAIAGYRREMLDLVRGLPESAYELSLRDIVEPPSPPLPLPTPPPPPPPSTTTTTTTGQHTDAEKDAAADGARSKKQGRKQRTARRQRSRSMERSVSLDTGLLIKLFMPLSVGGGGGKKKVSPKPDAGAKDAKKEKEKKQGKKKKAAAAVAAKEEEWWTKSEFSEAGSSSRTSSTGSSNSSAGSIRSGSGNGVPRAPVRSRSRKRSGCYAFFRANKGKNGASQD
ncbi:hypothetical protein ACP4OV_015020 [Aristida adscensionis]